MKKIKYLLLTLISLFIFDNIKAKSNISISSNSGNITEGNSVAITVTVSSDSPLAFIEGSVNCSGAGTNSSISLNWDDISNSVYSKNYSLNLTSTSSGTITCSTNGARATDMSSSSWQNLSAQTSVKVNAKPVVQQPVQTPVTTPKPNVIVTPKSSVNYLSSLSVEGKEILPKFDKETAEYTVELENGTSSINVVANAEHNKATITGTGNKNVTEGINNFEIVVTAENGSKRIYKLKAIVKEKDPIVVKIDNEEYTVIRKKEHLPEMSVYYTYSTVKINDEEIPCYFGEITGYTLVALKNSDGIINLFTYDEDTVTYKLYQEINFSKVTFYPIEPDNILIPEGFSKLSLIVNEKEIPCYKRNEKDTLTLIYGVNIENNNEGFYVYDSLENTLQRYDDAIFDSYKEEILILKSIIFGLVSIVLVVVIVSAVQGSINKNNKKLKSFTSLKKANIDKDEHKEKIKEAKLLEKELKRKEKQENKKHKKSLDDTNIIDITNINIKKKR